MDLEGFAKRMLRRGVPEERIVDELCIRICEIKDVSRERATEIAKAVVKESRTTLHGGYDPSGIRAWEAGVGCRGTGDLLIHQKIAEIIGAGGMVSPSNLDDAGVVRVDGKMIAVCVDGMHSRLSDYPFLAGFHAARASLRDIYVMGGKPVALFSDIHIADDGDVAKIFEYVAGISAVADASNVPYVTGSTLRIGGDMVIGDRMTGCVGAVGVCERVILKGGARVGDLILMTEGSGGGTVCTTALYHGREEVVRETLNLSFIKACDALHPLLDKISAMTDVTNGGIRGDMNDISSLAGVKIVLDEDRMRGLVNPRVLSMLEEVGVDWMGISIDSLVIFCREEHSQFVIDAVEGNGVKIDVIGRVEEGIGCELVTDHGRIPLERKFRESAYTPLKKVVGESSQMDMRELKNRIDEAFLRAVKKKEEVLRMLR